jgi:Tat protein secretion system quality control protein TatD with DNase activity
MSDGHRRAYRVINKYVCRRACPSGQVPVSAAGVVAQIEALEIFNVSVSMDPEGYEKSRAIDRQTDWILSTFGIHPWNAPRFHAQMEGLQPLIETSPMIGEIGLDYHWVREPSDHGYQREVFRYLIKEGVRQKKVVNIHTKGAEADVDRILGDLGVQRAIVHWYSGPLSTNFTRWQKRASRAEVEFTFGAFAIFEPHQERELYRNCWKQHEGIHFAGQHTSLKHAWIEGAVESGIRAAKEVLVKTQGR